MERETETAHLRAVLDASSAREGALAVISGPAGSGKTELLRELLRLAAERNVPVWAARALPGERDLPLGVVGQLVRSAEGGDVDTAPARAVLDAVTERAAHGRVTLEADETYTLHDWLRGAVRRKPLLVIDDVMLADTASLRFLRHCVAHSDQDGTGFVVTERSYTRADHADYRSFRAELIRQRHCRNMWLAGLPPSGIESVLTAHYESASARRLAPAYHAATGGNPLLVRALIQDRDAARSASFPALDDDAPIPGGAFAHAVLDCLHRTEGGVLETARWLAVLGHADPALLERLTGATGQTVERDLQELAAIGLLDGDGALRHPAIGEAALQELPTADLAAMHGAAAELLYQAGAEEHVVARHLLAGDLTNGTWTLPLLERGAQQALFEDRLDDAFRFLELAVRSSTDNAELARLAPHLVAASWRRNPNMTTRALTLFDQLLGSGLEPGQPVLPLIRCLVWYGRLPEAADALSKLRVGSESENLELAMTRMWLAGLCPPLLESLPPEADIDRGPVQVRLAARYTALQAQSRVLHRGPDDASVAQAEQILQSSRLSEETYEAVEAALLALVYADRLDRALRWSDELLAAAVERRSPGWEAVFAAIRGLVALRCGDLPTARSRTERALSHAQPESWGLVVGAPLSSLLLACTEVGAYEQAERVLRQPVPDTMFDSRPGVEYMHARGRYWLATGRLHAALGEFMLCGELLGSWNLDQPSIVPWRTSAAEVYLRLGNRQKARVLAESQLALLRPGHIRTRGLTLRVLAEAVDGQQAERFHAEAVDLLHESGDRLEHARALACMSRHQQSMGENDRARMTARLASDMAWACGAYPLAEESLPGRSRLKAKPVPPELELPGGEDVARLSDAERRVAALAARGLTNRQVARRLCVTVSTVEQHLTRVYRKLNVTRRVDLPAYLAQDQSDTA
ncbi:AAA family ATPase [Streptomyces sp. RY43-2]|uniref:AAA family ATPase n=1 Tax=Streptomyces macrolidinus TaxID=2952607 RepID=A0ABT0ZL94_9ACTN|nr:LuxR family transcriptional regulator [Streptomyces macrolidinus]MCN9244362.1 AAA family ATPase [Streptomyces macrolidinus]